MVEDALIKHKCDEHNADHAQKQPDAAEDVDRLGLIAAHEPDCQQVQKHFEGSHDAVLAAADASWAMIELLQTQKGLSRLDAYSLASMVMDCRLAQPSGAQKAVHCLVPKSTWVASR